MMRSEKLESILDGVGGFLLFFVCDAKKAKRFL